MLDHLRIPDNSCIVTYSNNVEKESCVLYIIYNSNKSKSKESGLDITYRL